MLSAPQHDGGGVAVTVSRLWRGDGLAPRYARDLVGVRLERRLAEGEAFAEADLAVGELAARGRA